MFYDLSARVFADGKGYLYRLTETQAPAGYQRLDAPMYVQTPYTVQDTVSYAVTYTVVNAGVSYLPAAGRFGGVYLPVLPGAGMIAASIAGACVLRRRRHAHGGGCDATCKKVR